MTDDGLLMSLRLPMPTFSVTLAETTAPPWTTLPAVAIGNVPRGLGTPSIYGLVSQDDRPARRIDLYGGWSTDAWDVAQATAIAWRGWLVLGFKWHLYLVATTDWSARTLVLPCYFQTLHAASDHLLIVFGSGLALVDAKGEVRWMNDGLAVDGVEVEAIASGVVRGRGELDPPGGWRPFAVSLAHGKAIDDDEGDSAT